MTASLFRRLRRADQVKIGLGIFMILTMIFIAAPIVIVVISSFSSASFIAFPIESYSLRWYWRVAEYRPFLDALGTSLLLAVTSSVCAAVIGVPAALALARSRSFWGTSTALFLLAPISIPAIVLGFGLLYFLSALGWGVSFRSLLVGHTIVGIPYVARTVMGVYRTVPPGLEEAAVLLGASRRLVLLHVTFPLVRSGMFAGILFAMLISLDNLPLSFFFGSSSTNTLPVVMLSYMQNQFDPSIAAISTIQMVIAVLSILVVDRLYGINRISAV